MIAYRRFGLVADRGIYRAGETAHMTAILRDEAAIAVANLPLTFVVMRPDGVRTRTR